MSRILLTVLFTHLSMLNIKNNNFHICDSDSVPHKKSKLFPPCSVSAKESQAQRVSPASKWCRVVNTWHLKQHLIFSVLLEMKPWLSNRFNAGWEGMDLESSICWVRFASDVSWHRGPSCLPLRRMLGSVVTQPEPGTSNTPHGWQPADPLQVPLEMSGRSFPSCMRQ